ncbi:hypothetical protein VE00_03486 [Pseudogymnoascus sp. WSF 3629]|nr:hypothetical protein VE00_03486 [Pseudogymnoascus sp. WSF 3629]
MKVGLEQSQTNLKTQFSLEHQPKPGQDVVLQSLWIFPIKSCQGIGLTRSRVLPSGLEFDRLYTFAQLKSSETHGNAYILFRFPWQDAGLKGVLSWAVTKITGGLKKQPEREVMLAVAFPSNKEIKMKGYTYENCSIWKDTVTALNMERDLPSKLALYLGARNRLALFRIDPGRLREVHRCTPTKDAAGYQPVMGFQDAVPRTHWHSLPLELSVWPRP